MNIKLSDRERAIVYSFLVQRQATGAGDALLSVWDSLDLGTFEGELAAQKKAAEKAGKPPQSADELSATLRQFAVDAPGLELVCLAFLQPWPLRLAQTARSAFHRVRLCR